MAFALRYFKYNLRYTANTTGEESTRSLSGINVQAEREGTGPLVNVAVPALISTLTSFSTGTFSDWRWITEREVTL